MEQKAMYRKLFDHSFRAVHAAYANFQPLIDALSEKLKCGSSPENAKEASKAFQSLYLRSGALETTLGDLNSFYYSCTGRYYPGNLGAGIQTLRRGLNIIGGSSRESQDFVIGQTLLGDEKRVKGIIEFLADLKQHLKDQEAEEQIELGKNPG